VEGGDAAREGEGMEGGGVYSVKRPQVKLAAASLLYLQLYTNPHPHTVSNTDTQI